MSEPKKVLRNQSGGGYPLEYDGNRYLLQPGLNIVSADLADFAQAKDPRVLQIAHGVEVDDDFDEALEPENKAHGSPEPVMPAAAPAPVLEFTCPQGDWKGNTQEGLDAHTAEAHPATEPPKDLDQTGGLGEQPKDEQPTPGAPDNPEQPAPAATEATAAEPTPPEPSMDVPPVESPSTDSLAAESPSAEPSQE